MSFCISLSLSISLHFPPFLFLPLFSLPIHYVVSLHPLFPMPRSHRPFSLHILLVLFLILSLLSPPHFISIHLAPSPSLIRFLYPPSPISLPLPSLLFFFLPRATSPLCLSPHFFFFFIFFHSLSFLSLWSRSSLFSHCSISLVLPPLIDIPSLLVSPFLPSSTPSPLIFSAFHFLPFSLSRIPFSSLLPSPFSSYSSSLFFPLSSSSRPHSFLSTFLPFIYSLLYFAPFIRSLLLIYFSLPSSRSPDFFAPFLFPSPFFIFTSSLSLALPSLVLAYAFLYLCLSAYLSDIMSSLERILTSI